jgi:hypothetical protein
MEIKKSKFFVVSMDYWGGGEDTISYNRRECGKIANDYLYACRLRKINNVTITTYSVEIEQGNFTEQAFFDGNVKVLRRETIETITYKF